MAGGRPKNTKGGSVSYDKRRDRYVVQYYIVDKETHAEKRLKKTVAACILCKNKTGE